MYKRIYDSDEIMVDQDGRKLRISVFEDGHWVGEHFVELPELEPVVHAHWVIERWGSGYIKRCNCSNCGNHPKDPYAPPKYCDNCGAHMDEEVSE